MKIKYDYQIFISQKYGGVSKYFVNFLKLIKKKNNNNLPIILAPIYINNHLKEYHDYLNVLGIHLNINSKILLRSLRYVNYFLDFLISIPLKYDITHLTYFSVISGSFINKKSKLVITVHDMTYEIFPSYFKNSYKTINAKKKLINQSDAIIAVSQNTKKDLLNYYKIDEKKIKVIYHGIDLIKFKKNYNDNKIHKKKFILYVGQRDGYKNFNILLEVYIENKLLNENYDLILFGGEMFSDKLYDEHNRGFKNKKIFQVNGDDELLSKYYSNASVFISTSLYEGFGMTILEAMACECPVIAGNNSSIPEISGNASYLVNMQDKNEVLSALYKVLNNKNFRENLINLGLKNVKKFDWYKTADETISLYNSLLR